jgi:copper homeostasis protein CutC
MGFAERQEAVRLLRLAVHDTNDGIGVLSGAGLHPEAVADLTTARGQSERAATSLFGRRRTTREAIQALQRARSRMIEAQP